MAATDRRLRRSPRVVYRTLPDGAGLLHLDTGTFHQLNHTGVLIWELLDEGATLEEVVTAVASQVSEPPPDLEGEIATFLDALTELGLVELTPAPG